MKKQCIIAPLMSAKIRLFIDTSIFLTFYHFSKDGLEKLKEVFASHQRGDLHIHMTTQVIDEFRRNRAKKIQEAISQFENNTWEMQPPSVLLNYDEIDRFHDLRRELKHTRQEILSKARKDIDAHTLEADKLISNIIKHASVSERTDDIVELAKKRRTIGNPPGTKASIGDAINWLLLLQDIPGKEDLHLISTDNDFFSPLDKEAPEPFLKREWAKVKSTDIHVYRSISAFLEVNFPGDVIPYDFAKNQLINNLSFSPSFATTHSIIAQLDKYTDFSLKEVRSVLQAVSSNSQVGGILTDRDIVEFLDRVAMPHRSEIKEKELTKILDDLAKHMESWDDS